MKKLLGRDLSLQTEMYVDHFVFLAELTKLTIHDKREKGSYQILDEKIYDLKLKCLLTLNQKVFSPTVFGFDLRITN